MGKQATRAYKAFTPADHGIIAATLDNCKARGLGEDDTFDEIKNTMVREDIAWGGDAIEIAHHIVFSK